MARLAGKVAVITGGAGGIGRAAGAVFAEQGAKVVLVDIDEPGLKKAARSIKNKPVKCVTADVSKPVQVRGYVQAALDNFGRIDVFVSNAGVEGVVKGISRYPDRVFDKVMAVNVKGAWLGLKHVIPQMKKTGGGSIIITSSYAGIRGVAGVSAYVASKHALVGLTRAVALECAGMGIRVNAINPGPVDDRMMQSMEGGIAPDDQGWAREMIRKGIPLKRYGEPQEVAKVMLFLASDESSFCTGGVYVIDGGISAR